MMESFLQWGRNLVPSTMVTILFIALGGGIVVAYYIFYPAIVAASDSSNSFATLPQPEILSQSQSISTQPLLTLVIPAYLEEERLPKMIHEAHSYLNTPNCTAIQNLVKLRRRKRPMIMKNDSNNVNIEWIVVNDGSNDRTCQVYRNYVHNLTSNTHHPTEHVRITQHDWKLISLPKNRGKGAAVRCGMLASTGDYALMVDADGATEFGPGLEALTQRLIEQSLRSVSSSSSQTTSTIDPIVLGSRAHLHLNKNNHTHQRRSHVRSFLMQAFHVCVVLLVDASEICDTQCGFKLFSKNAAHHLFQILHLRRWAFDTELIFLATHLHYTILEVVVPWHEVEGSKLHTSALNLALVSVSMLRDMVCVRLCYAFGLWKIPHKVQ